MDSSERAYFDPASEPPADPNLSNDEDILTEYVYSSTAPTTALLERSYVHKDGDPNSGFGSRYEYDPNTVMLKRSFVVNSNNPMGSTSQAFNYASKELVRDPNTGIVTATINPQGVRSDVYFDQLGRVTKSITSDPNGAELPTFIDYTSILETRVIRPSDPNHAVLTDLGDNFSKVRYLYDTLGRVKETRRRTETATSSDCEAIQKTVYDVAGRAEFVSEWGFESSCNRGPFEEDPQEFDPNSYVPDSNSPTENIGTRYLYYTLNQSTRVYDPLGRIQQVIRADHKPTTRTYSGMGTTVTVDVANQPVSAYSELDAFGRLALVDAPTGADASYGYNTLGELQQVELTGLDPDTNTPVVQGRYFTYDGLGRLKSSTNPEDGTVQFTKFDAAGRLLEKIDDAGTKFSFYYDAAGRVLSAKAKEHSTDPNAPTRTLAQYFYDESGITGSAGQLTKVESFDETGTLVSRRSYVYAGRNGRVSEDVTRFGPWDTFAGVSTFGDKQLKLCYFYDQQGLLTQMRYPADATCTKDSAPDGVALLNYTYRNGVLNKIQDAKRSADLINSVAYNAPGGLRELVLGNGKATSIAPDSMSRLDAISVVDPNNRSAAALFQTGHYTFDGSGNILSIGPSDANTIDEFEYDPLSRLTESHVYFQDPNGSHVYHETYGYDDFGNMLQKTKELGASGASQTNLLTSHASNRLSAVNNVPTAYDPAGNYLGTFQRADPNSPLEAVRANLFDARNRLLAAGESPKAFPVGQYAYDAAGLRIMKAFPRSGERTFYLRDPAGNVLSEFTLPPNKFDEYTQKDYFYALGQVVGMAEEKSPVGVQGVWSSMYFYPGDEDMAASGSVTLNWDKNPDLGIDSDPNGYRVYRKVGLSGTWSLLTTTSKTVATFTDGMNGPSIEGQSYYYKIAAINAAGNEGISSRTLKFVMAENSTPAAPTSPSLEKHDHSLTLRWQRSTDDYGYANTASDPQTMFLGYQVYRQETSSGNWLKRNALPLAEPVFHDLTAADPNITYSYQIKSVNTGWQESSGAATSSGSPGDDDPPAPPTGFRALSGPDPNMITLVWNPSAESDLEEYSVYIKDGENYTMSHDVDPNDPNHPTSYSWSDLDPNASYTFAVVARDATSTSPLSNDATATPRSQSPATPAHPTIPLRRLSWELNPHGGAVLTWGSVSGALDYTLHRRLDTEPWSAFRPIYRTTNLVHTDTSIDWCRAYSYVVRASDAQGHVSADPNEEVFTERMLRPSKPLAVGNASAKTITLSWDRQTNCQEQGNGFEVTAWVVRASADPNSVTPIDPNSACQSYTHANHLVEDPNTTSITICYPSEADPNTPHAFAVVAKVTNTYHSNFPGDEEAYFDSMISEDICSTMHESDLGNVCPDISNNDPQGSGWGGAGADPNNDDEPATLIKPHRRNTSIRPFSDEPSVVGYLRLALALPEAMNATETSIHRPRVSPPERAAGTVRQADLARGLETKDLSPVGKSAPVPTAGLAQPSDCLEPLASTYRLIGAASAKQFKYSYFHLDHLGSVRLVTDPNGDVISTSKFLPFGEEILGAGLSRNTHQYTGHELDAETDSDYMKARYFEQGATMRFMSVDPVSAFQTNLYRPDRWNRYGYVHNNPMNLIDPDGREAYFPNKHELALMASSSVFRNQVPHLIAARSEAVSATTAEFGTIGDGDVSNAFLHIALAASLTQRLGAGSAKLWTDLHESGDDAAPESLKALDRYHNSVGIALASDPANAGKSALEIASIAISKGLYYTLSDPSYDVQPPPEPSDEKKKPKVHKQQGNDTPGSTSYGLEAQGLAVSVDGGSSNSHMKNGYRDLGVSTSTGIR